MIVFQTAEAAMPNRGRVATTQDNAQTMHTWTLVDTVRLSTFALLLLTWYPFTFREFRSHTRMEVAPLGHVKGPHVCFTY